jgi:CTP:molybdopterin cytidylyltransferase MocA
MTDKPLRTMGVVLAAGEGRRFGGPKAPHVIDGERLVDRAVRVLRAGGCDDVVVVLGAWECAVPDALVVVNHGWEEGMGSSLRIGLKWARACHAERALVTLVDLPGLTPDAVRRIVEAEGSIVQAMYDGEGGHPVRLDAALLDDVIRSVQGDEGARAFLRERDDIARVEVGDVASGQDLDEPAT